IVINAGVSISTAAPSNGGVGVPYSASLAATGGTSPYTFNASALPAGLTINAAGQITGTPTTAGTTQITFTVTDSTNPTHLSNTANLSITISPGLVFTTSSLPNGTVNVAYPATTLTAVNGTAPYTFTATNLPAGLTISAGGQITGTPTAAGTTQVTFTVTDSTSPAHNTATANLSITIVPAPVQITTASLPNGSVSVAY